ncbi:unnamed protein product [Adineta ricciae]|uniref:Uncharacterized protein n=1 Tax=Adineta ricciae TaxID=249248 RepID=A0A816E628_ADIRI|nr:unnamed protein product [Adineta ricciae]CAF1643490.1 unnamed protein product [Adineta ricciae]
MENADNSSSDQSSSLDNFIEQLYLIQFCIFIILVIPSIICSFFALYYLLSDRILRQLLNNHIIIILLILTLLIQCTDIPLQMHYFRTFKSFSSSLTLRFFWLYIDWTLFVLHSMLYTWTTIERHILIFHSHLFGTKMERICLHYFPPFIITIYCCLFYIVVFFVVQCNNGYGDPSQTIIYPCAFENEKLALYDNIVHSIFPTLSIVIFSFALLFRILWQKYHIHGHINWRQNRKMTIQVLSISFIYLILTFPYFFVDFLQFCGIPSYIGASFTKVAVNGIYYMMFLFPIVSIGALPELRGKMKKILQLPCQQRIIAPINTVAIRI